MFAEIEQLLAELNLIVCETVDVPPRSESMAVIPKAIAEGPAATMLSRELPGNRMWMHQAQALQQLGRGRNVVISTGTASGKSLIFQTYAIHRLLAEPNSKVLVFYPLLALSADQFVSWKNIAKAAGLEEKSVERIDGSVPIKTREAILEKSSIILMTPDVCQAWFMRNLSNPAIRGFIDSLALLVLDEAHVYESVFGSNAAFLLRRLLAAKRQPGYSKSSELRFQIVAATATIQSPAEHLENLTGLKFEVIDESANGAPRSLRQIVHVEGPELGREGEQTLAKLLSGICSLREQRRFIAFVDFRQGVERIAMQIGKETVKPYRSGLETRDRRSIEEALKSNNLHGVIATSALELGIDISSLDIGINLGVPQSRKSFRQRLGRIGRVNQGAFLVVAPQNAFTKFGSRLADYYESSVEPSYLYLGNRFVQFAHAKCLRDEMEGMGQASENAPRGVSWPEGFSDLLKVARVGYPREFDPMAQIGGDSPHLNYPLRQLGELHVEIQQGSGGFEKELGNMAYHQAIREAYPGATYLHMGRPYKIDRWSQGFNKLLIHGYRANNAAPTRPILRKGVTIDLSRAGVMPDHMKKGHNGLLAEAQVQVNESVEGFRIGNTQHLYRDEQATNPNMRRKQRNFRTTGVVVKIEEDWFADTAIRKEIAEGLRDLLARERSIAPQDIDSAHTNIALSTDAGLQQPITDVVVVYDSVYGGLRLTENLFVQFSRYIERLLDGAQLSDGDGIVSFDTAERLENWARGLSEGTPDDAKVNIPEGWLQVFKPGSVVGVYRRGEIFERKLIEPQYKDPFNTGERVLYYAFEDGNDSVKSFTPADSTETVGHDWEYVLWNPETGEYRELEASE